MEGDALHRNLDFRVLVASVGRLPLLCTEPGLDVQLTATDLYLCDQQSWQCLRGLLNLLEDKDVQFYSGISSGCVLLASDECHFAWTLRKSASQYGIAGDGHLGDGHINVFNWYV